MFFTDVLSSCLYCSQSKGERWEREALEARENRRLACHRLRANRLEEFYGEGFEKGHDRGVNHRFPVSTSMIREGTKERLQSRLQRLSDLNVPDGVFPPFRAPEMMLASFGQNGARPVDEIDRFFADQHFKVGVLICGFPSHWHADSGPFVSYLLIRRL